jgi:hypothetical protein
VVGSCENGIEPLGSIKGGEFPDQLSTILASHRTLLHGVSYRHSLHHGFSNCGTRTTTSTPTIVYWYAAVIKKNRNINKG